MANDNLPDSWDVYRAGVETARNRDAWIVDYVILTGMPANASPAEIAHINNLES